MPIPSLYECCLGEIYCCMKKGRWKSGSSNPFSRLPSLIVNDLMEFTWDGHEKIADVFLLLTSGKLTHLSLSPYDLGKEGGLLLKAIRANGLKSLKYLEDQANVRKRNHVVEKLIRKCPALEEFHSAMIPSLEVFKNCPQLRRLKFPFLHHRLQEVFEGHYPVLASLKHLEVFYVSAIEPTMAAKVLESCPQLLSLGPANSLEGIEKFHENNANKCSDPSFHLQLRRCFWGSQTSGSMSRQIFSERIKIAVSLCPLLEELVIFVLNPSVLEELKTLKHLRILRLMFIDCDGDCERNLVELLQVLGPQLKILSLKCTHPFSVDVICDACPRLLKLNVLGETTASRFVQSNKDLILKRIEIVRVDEKSLFFLLSSCMCLENLLVYYAPCLNDSLLNRVLKLNPLPKLKLMKFREWNLSNEAVMTFMKERWSPYKSLHCTKKK